MTLWMIVAIMFPIQAIAKEKPEKKSWLRCSVGYSTKIFSNFFSNFFSSVSLLWLPELHENITETIFIISFVDTILNPFYLCLFLQTTTLSKNYLISSLQYWWLVPAPNLSLRGALGRDRADCYRWSELQMKHTMMRKKVQALIAIISRQFWTSQMMAFSSM